MLKWSNFLVTLNTNSRSLETLDDLRNAIDIMPTYPYVWQWLYHVSPGGKKIAFDEATSQLVDRVRVRCAFESAGSTGNVHAHCIIEVGHRTMVQIDAVGLREFFQEHLPINVGFNLNNKFVPGKDMEYTLQYITKESSAAASSAPRPYRRLMTALEEGSETVDAEGP